MCVILYLAKELLVVVCMYVCMFISIYLCVYVYTYEGVFFTCAKPCAFFARYGSFA